jgi:hypothetical protein
MADEYVEFETTSGEVLRVPNDAVQRSREAARLIHETVGKVPDVLRAYQEIVLRAAFSALNTPTVDEGAKEALAQQFEHAAWKGFNQSDSEFEKGYKHAMSVAAKRVREFTCKQGDTDLRHAKGE